MTVTKERGKTDEEIQLDVIAELNRDRRFKPAEVGVEVDHGVVTLTGTVSSYVKTAQAAGVAATVAGVRDVANRLTTEGARDSDDTRTAEAVRAALTSDVEVPEERIDSIVRDGVVTLMGTVESWYEREAARNAVARVAGIRDIDDRIVLAPTGRTERAIYEDIKATLLRRLPWTDVDVAVDGCDVTLMGTVRTYAVRAEVDDIVRATAGVSGVANKIVVRP